MIKKNNYPQFLNFHSLIFTVSIFLFGCATNQPKIGSKDSLSSQPIPYRIGEFDQCPLSEMDIDLLISIEKGTVEPNISANDSDRVALSLKDMNTWRTAQNLLENYYPPLVVDKNNSKPLFVAIFDGTWNDREDLGNPLTIPAKLSYELENLYKNNKLIVVKYYNGVGTRVSLFRALRDGISGAGTLERSELALEDFQAAIQEFKEIPNVYTIGFSRGAASARHFLNLVDPILNMPSDFFDLDLNRSRSFSLLFDTVATGQLNNLNLEIPVSTMSTLHLVATQERRASFPYVTILSNLNKDFDFNTALELKLPGAHSNLGGGYGSGLEVISFMIAKKWLIEQGFALYLNEVDTLSVVNEGRHNSDWIFTSFTDGLLRLFGKRERKMIEPISLDTRELTTGQITVLGFEKSVLRVKSAKATSDRLTSKLKNGEDVSKKFLSLNFSRNRETLIIDTNCPKYVSFDPKNQVLLLKDFSYFSVRDLYQELELTPGIIKLIEAQKAENFRNVRL